MSFAVSDVSKAVAPIRRADKSWAKTPLALPADAPQEKDEFIDTGGNPPAGEWGVLDPAGVLAIISRFDPAEISHWLLNRSARDNRVNLEPYSKPAQLAPGQSLSLKHAIELVPEATKPLQP